MAQGVLRTRKDGGCSICRAPEDKVGKRRCCHVLDGAEMSVRKEGGTQYVDISGKIGKNDETFSIKASTETVKNYISSLSKGLNKKEKDGILNILRG